MTATGQLIEHATDSADHIAHLPGIGLDELDAQASLQTRVDRKYLLAPADLAAVLDRLPTNAHALEVEGERAPAYESTYLDTADLAAFHAAAHRRRRRWKVRTRTYAVTDTSFLEVKTRRHATTVKQRTPWPGTPELGPDGLTFVTVALEDAGVPAVSAPLEPVLGTRYLRTTLLLPTDGARVTIDRGLTWLDATALDPDDPAHPDPGSAAWPDRIVLETKTAGAPCSLDRALWSLGHRPQPLSKYAVGMALLHPGLPRNRWHRLLAA